MIPGGVDSPVRSFASVGGTPYTVVSGEGASVVDVEGNRYLDMVQSYGAVLLGHAHPGSRRPWRGRGARHDLRRAHAGRGAAGRGHLRAGARLRAGAPRLFGDRGRHERHAPGPGLTGRDRVVKFDGCYHGHSDGLLAEGGSGVATLGLPARPACPQGPWPTPGRPLQRGPRPRRAGGLCDRRAGGGEHGPGGAGAGIPRGLRAAAAPAARSSSSTRSSPASGSGRRVPRAGRCHPRPVVLRQGHRRRAAGGRVRRAP